MVRLLAIYLLLLSFSANNVNGQDSEASGQYVQQASVTDTDYPNIYDCSDVVWNGKDSSGVYTLVVPHVTSFKVFCDVSDAKGGWAVIQRRFDGSVNFERNWDDYVTGFGQWKGEFWLGLQKIHQVTKYKSWKLRFDLEHWDGSSAYAEYESFRIGDEASNYALTIGAYSGTAGDALNVQDSNYGCAFSTYDNDNDQTDRSSDNCASLFQGGWWFHSCDPYGNVNGQYKGAGQYSDAGMIWWTWKGWESLKLATMMIQPYYSID